MASMVIKTPAFDGKIDVENDQMLTVLTEQLRAKFAEEAGAWVTANAFDEDGQGAASSGGTWIWVPASSGIIAQFDGPAPAIDAAMAQPTD